MVNEYGTKEYWNDFYQESKDEFFDWLQKFENYFKFLKKYLKKEFEILHIGCGNSDLSINLYKNGFSKIMNIDYSNIIIENFKKKFIDFPSIKWKTMDCTNMKEFNDSSYDIVLDKGTLDAIFCSDSYILNVFLTLNEIHRVLKNNCFYLIISYGSPEQRLKLLVN